MKYQLTWNLFGRKAGIVFASLLGSIFLFSPGTILAFDYVDNPNNPVFDGGQSWDNLAVISPVVHYDGDSYKMWFAGRNVGNPIQIGYATSPDGVIWTENENPVLTVGPTGSFDSANLQKLTVLKEDTGYKMWYTASDASGVQRLGLATSLDGINWSKYDQNPVLVSGGTGSWNEALVKGPSVLKIDGIYFMWFIGQSAEHEPGIGLAYSSDGIIWEEDANNPVMQRVPGNAWESQYSTGPHVSQREDGSFLMVYMGYDGTHRRIGMAHSQNGIDWNRNTHNPIVAIGEAGSWNADVSSDPFALILEPGHYAFWYTGNSNYATSTSWFIGQGDLNFESEGDINYDYQLDVSDIIQLVNIILGTQSGSDYQYTAGDMNQDSSLTVSDLIILVETILQ